MKKNNRLSLFKSIGDNIDILIYEPTFGKWYCQDLEPMKPVRWIRLLTEYIRGGFLVFYLRKEEELCSYSVTARGGRRLKCSTKEDIVIGPEFTCAQHRGKGYNGLIKRAIADYYKSSAKALYNYIDEDNKASINATLKFGFKPVGRLHVTRLLRRLIETPDGEHIIFRYSLGTENTPIEPIFSYEEDKK
jgi:L-amino acid N-acyltransferase YncA